MTTKGKQIMSAIIKVGYNTISKNCEAAGDGGKIGKLLYYHIDDDGEQFAEMPDAPLLNGKAYEEETVAA